MMKTTSEEGPWRVTTRINRAGNLTLEIELAGDQIAWVVIGIGVNVSWLPTGMVDGRDLSEIATSVGAAAGRPSVRLGRDRGGASLDPQPAGVASCGARRGTGGARVHAGLGS